MFSSEKPKKKRKPDASLWLNNANIVQVSSYSVVVVPPVIGRYHLKNCSTFQNNCHFKRERFGHICTHILTQSSVNSYRKESTDVILQLYFLTYIHDMIYFILHSADILFYKREKEYVEIYKYIEKRYFKVLKIKQYFH